MSSLHDIHEPVLRDYLQQGLDEWDRLGHLPEADTLRDLAMAVAMSNDDSETADQLSLELTEKARQLIQNDDDKSAEELLRLAALLSPVRLQPHYLLADLYGRYYRRYRHEEHRIETIYLAQRSLSLAPEHTPAHALLEEMGVIRKMDGISWKHAAMIVAVLVLISGTMTVCVRFTMVPDVDPADTERVRQYFDEQGAPAQRP